MSRSQHDTHVTSSIKLPSANPKLKDYGPLFIIVTVIVLGSLAVCAKVGFTAANLLGYSMGFFFLLFGMFKVLDLSMFAMGYREYDLIAKRIPAWGYVYPFVELALAGIYLAGLSLSWANWTTLILSMIIVLGVAIKLAKHEIVQCVCLGNILKVPLTYVSLIEYGLMGTMAALMLFV